MDAPNRLWYELDDEDRVVAAGGWDASVRSGHARDALVGRRLWDLVGEIETEHLLRHLLRGVRARGRAAEVPFRRDVPGVLRFMRLRAVPLPSGTVRVSTELLREVKVEVSAPPPPVEEMVAMCSWCSRIRLSDGRWAELADAVAQLYLLASAAPPPITHGLCRDCLQAMEPLVDAPSPAPADGGEPRAGTAKDSMESADPRTTLDTRCAT